MASRWTYKVTRDESRRDSKKQRTNKHRSPLAFSRDLARDAPGPEGGEKSVARDVVRELDAWTRARLVEGLRAVPV